MVKHYMMVFLRETNNHTQIHLANVLGISLSKYIDLEEGKVFLNDEIIIKLKRFYKQKDEYFSEPSLQNELFKMKDDFIKGLLGRIQILQQQITDKIKAPKSTVIIEKIDEPEEEMKDDILKDHDIEESQRFIKPERLIDRVTREPYDCITEVFLDLHLDDICQEIDQWLRIALINDQSAYEEGQAREDLMDFCRELQVLVEAFHVKNELNKPKDSDDVIKKLPYELREKIEQFDQTELLSPEQIANPLQVINDFCNTYKLSYARAELWDLLDAVISFQGEKVPSNMNILITYQCISCLIEIAYVIKEKED